jgi:hypothetical protein
MSLHCCLVECVSLIIMGILCVCFLLLYLGLGGECYCLAEIQYAVCGLLHCVIVGDVANILETARTSEMSATLPTTTHCKNPRTELS